MNVWKIGSAVNIELKLTTKPRGGIVINVLVTIDVLDFNYLYLFECKAAEVMYFHGGKIVRAFETQRNEDNTGLEVHLLEFPSEIAFSNYRKDLRLVELSGLRDMGIKSTNVSLSIKLKVYA